MQMYFSRQEKMILRCILSGYTNQEIADQAGVPLGTAANRIYHVFKKIKAKNRTKATNFMLSHPELLERIYA